MTNQVQLTPTNQDSGASSAEPIHYSPESSMKLQRQMKMLTQVNFNVMELDQTKAQKPPHTTKLRSITHNNDNFDSKTQQFYDPVIMVKKVKYVQEKAQLYADSENRASNIESQAQLSAPSKIEKKKVVAPSSPRQRPQKQIRYLGLCIEKDAEYAEYPEECNDNVERLYYPIREAYIEIVKHCRKLTLESYDRKGRSDLKKTTKNILRKSRHLHKARGI